MNKHNYLYQILIYAGVIPFLVGTYFTWCGPMQEILYAAQLFSLYSIFVLSFLAGRWWTRTITNNKARQTKLALVGCLYILFLGAAWLMGYRPLTIILLGFGYVALGLYEFFAQASDEQGSYQITRILLTLTIFVCHLLVAMQIYTL